MEDKIFSTTYPFVGILRSCCRCGQEFSARAKELVCSCCKEATVNKPKPSSPSLSTRERQIAHLVTQAKSNKEIAFELHLTPGTVKEYMCNIFRKLGMRNRTELALWGQRNLAA